MCGWVDQMHLGDQRLVMGQSFPVAYRLASTLRIGDPSFKVSHDSFLWNTKQAKEKYIFFLFHKISNLFSLQLGNQLLIYFFHFYFSHNWGKPICAFTFSTLGWYQAQCFAFFLSFKSIFVSSTATIPELRACGLVFVVVPLQTVIVAVTTVPMHNTNI